MTEQTGRKKQGANTDGHNSLDFFYTCFEGMSTTMHQVGNEAKTDDEDRTITLIARDPREQK